MREAAGSVSTTVQSGSRPMEICAGWRNRCSLPSAISSRSGPVRTGGGAPGAAGGAACAASTWVWSSPAGITCGGSGTDGRATWVPEGPGGAGGGGGANRDWAVGRAPGAGGIVGTSNDSEGVGGGGGGGAGGAAGACPIPVAGAGGLIGRRDGQLRAGRHRSAPHQRAVADGVLDHPDPVDVGPELAARVDQHPQAVDRPELGVLAGDRSGGEDDLGIDRPADPDHGVPLEAEDPTVHLDHQRRHVRQPRPGRPGAPTPASAPGRWRCGSGSARR